MSYVLRRTDQGGGYVAPAGSRNAYTRDRRNARVYRTRADAEADRCPDNEVIEHLNEPR